MPTFFSRERPSGGAPTAAPPLLGQFHLDGHRRVVHCLNDAARQLVRDGLPMTASDLAARPLTTREGDTVTETDLPLRRAWREQTAQEAILLMTTPGGELRRLHWTAAPVRGPDGDVVGAVGAVAVLPPEPDWQVLAGLAHDLRTPLQTLKLLVPLLHAAPLLDPRASQALEHLRSAAERAQALGLDLLEWCKGPLTGGRAVTRAWFPLQTFLIELVGEAQVEARRKRIDLSCDLRAAGGVEVCTDKVRLGRLLANLLTNAVRYTDAGRVRMLASWRADGSGRRQELALTIVDMAGGLAPEEQDSIFQPFERGRAGKDKDSDSGSGVGLATVERLVEELGLKLEVFSEFGHGSTFELVLSAEALREAAR
jgi:signal transduction histidine kinase